MTHVTGFVVQVCV